MNELLVSTASFWRLNYFIWQLPKGEQSLGLYVIQDDPDHRAGGMQWEGMLQGDEDILDAGGS